MFLASIAALALLVTEPPPNAGKPPAPQVSCSNSASLKQAFQDGAAAYKADDLATAKVDFDAMITACGETRPSWLPRLYRSLIALQEKDFDAAWALIQPIPRTGAPKMGAAPSFIALRAHAGRKDLAAFNTERDQLLAASARGLTDAGGIKGRFIEDFAVGDYKVSAFEAKFPQEAFVRHFQFTVIPPGDFAMPMSISVSTDLASGLLGGGEAYFLDEYTCEMHATLTILNKKPDYATLKAAVTKALQGKASAVSSTTPPSGFCAWPDFIVPGLEG